MESISDIPPCSIFSILSLRARYALSVPCYRIGLHDDVFLLQRLFVCVCLYVHTVGFKATQLFTCSSCTVNPELGLYPPPSYHGSRSLAYIRQWSNIYHREWMEKKNEESPIKTNQNQKETCSKWDRKHLFQIVDSFCLSPSPSFSRAHACVGSFSSSWWCILSERTDLIWPGFVHYKKPSGDSRQRRVDQRSSEGRLNDALFMIP